MSEENRVPTAKPASVVFARIREFGSSSVAEQATLKARLEARAAAALDAVPASERVVLDARDGIAIVITADPLVAFDVAQRLARKSRSRRCVVGLNHGAVKLVTDAQGGPALMGDGLSTAAAIATFAKPGRMLATRSFRDALDVNSPGAARRLELAGTSIDDQVRTHELFAINPQASLQYHRRLLLAGIVGSALLIGGGVAVRWGLDEWREATQGAVIVFDVKPQAEVSVDGEHKGSTPPLAQIELASGPHTLELTAAGFPPYSTEVQVAPGERITIQHRFVAAPKPAKAGKQGKGGFWQDLRRRLGN